MVGDERSEWSKRQFDKGWRGSWVTYILALVLFQLKRRANTRGLWFSIVAVGKALRVRLSNPVKFQSGEDDLWEYARLHFCTICIL